MTKITNQLGKNMQAGGVIRQNELIGRVQTVLGAIDANSLGVTLTHEHLLVDLSVYFVEPTEASEQALAHQPVSLGNLNWIRHHWTKNLDDNLLQDEQTAIDEAMFYRKAGGNTIVECSNIGLHRDPLGLARIAQATGLNIVMGSGYYIGSSHPPELATKTEEEITEEIVREIMVGVGDTVVRAGIIGEIGSSVPLKDNERKILRASAAAQRRTGAALNIHPPLHVSTKEPRRKEHEDVVIEILKTLSDAGADLRRTIISHVDVCCFTPTFHRKLVERGCYLEYDVFGLESYPDEDDLLWDIPSDSRRIDEIVQLIAEGYLNHILISHDICMKHQLRRYGGWGYDHILSSVVPLMRHKSMSDEQIHTLLVENPKRVLPFAPVK
ncbi:phosphotriesterase [Chloroflexota bacterium]